MKSDDIIPPSKPLEENGDIHLHDVLLSLKKVEETNLNSFLKRILVAAANSLNADRVSIWFFNDDRTRISCHYMYLKQTGSYIKTEDLEVTGNTEYFKAIDSKLILCAEDALTDPNTMELSASYLIPNNIVSMMDVPVYYRGRTVGIICNENVKSKRKWQEEEKNFAASIASLVSNAIEIDLKESHDKDLQESQRFLSTLISNLPGYVYRVKKEDTQWTFQYLSDGITDITGYTPKELIESDHLYYGLMVDETDKKNARMAVNDALINKKPYEITYRIKSTDGKLKWVWERGRGVYDEMGSLVATEGFITDITERKLTEEEVLKRNAELSAINKIGQSLSKLAEKETIIHDICAMLGKLFNIENLYIALYDEDKNLITFPYYTIEGKMLSTPSRNFGKGLTEFVIKTKKSLLINSARHEVMISLGIKPHGKEALSILATPMIAGEKVLGVIALQNYRFENAFSQSQIETLSTIASQAAIALENAELYSSLKKSLSEKEILLQEVHHRVKNNLQIMSSLIKLQSHYVSDKQMLQILKETESRIQSMAIVHSKLYSTQEYEKINFGEYVKNLTDNFWNTYGIKLKNLKFDLQIENIALNIDTAIPCGLIINELVSNAIKHAFPDNMKGTITVILSKEKDIDIYKLIVKDDGAGISDIINIDKTDTLGIQLVKLLSKQMNGSLEVKSAKNKGSEFIIKLEESHYKSRK